MEWAPMLMCPWSWSCLCLSLPAGVVSIVTGAGAVGGYLSEHDGIDKLSFTGSVPTGIKVMTAGTAYNHHYIHPHMDRLGGLGESRSELH